MRTLIGIICMLTGHPWAACWLFLWKIVMR